MILIQLSIPSQHEVVMVVAKSNYLKISYGRWQPLILGRKLARAVARKR